MKNIAVLFTLLWAAAAFGQSTANKTLKISGPDKTPAVAPAPKATPTAIRDFNYSFLPTDQYRRFSLDHVIDSVSKQIKWTPDSVGQSIQVQIEKQNDELTIRGLADPTQIHYREHIKFIGHTQDGQNCLVYRADTPGRELIIVNPILGFAVVAFQTCNMPGMRPGECDLMYHYFGAVPFRSYLP